MVLAEAATTPRGWDNGVGGYQTNSILETRIGGTQEGRKLLLEIFNFQYIYIYIYHCRLKSGKKVQFEEAVTKLFD